MAKTGRHYYFVARNEKTKTGYHISFPNIPNAEAVGTTYEETVYYSYRVLADFLSHLPKQEAEIRAYTLSDIPDTVASNVFYSLVSVTPDFDPHKMERTLRFRKRHPPTFAKKRLNLLAS